MSKLPRYMIRSDDHIIFSLNEDGETYSTHDSKLKWPDNLHHKYKYDRLIKAGFYSAPESELSYHRYKTTEYYIKLDKQLNKEKGCGD